MSLPRLMKVRIEEADEINSITLKPLDLAVKNTVYRFNLLNLSDDEKKCLGRLLYFLYWRNRSVNFINEPYAVTIKYVDGSSESCIFQFSHTLILRLSHSDQTQMRVDVVGDQLGSGGFSLVHRVLATLFVDHTGMLISKAAKRVLKMQSHTPIYPGIRAQQEAQIATQAGYFHMKEPVMIANYSFLTSRFIKGVSLADYLEQKSPDTNDRLMIALNILYSLKEQLQDRDIISRDIKPENMLLDPDNFHIKHIDLGLALHADDDVRECCGTRGYIAPEIILHEKICKATDVYSAALVIAEVFNAESLCDDSKVIPAEPYQLSFKGLFRDLYFSESQQKQIRGLLAAMTRTDPCARISLKNAIVELESVWLERLSDYCSLDTMLSIRAVYQQADALRQMLDPRELINEADQSGRDSQDILLEKLKTLLLPDVLRLPENNAYAIRAYCLVLPLRGFVECQTRTGLFRQIEGVIEEYEQARVALKESVASIEALRQSKGLAQSQTEALETGISMVYYAHEMRTNFIPPMLDNLPELISKIRKTTMEIDWLYRYHEKIVSAQAGNDPQKVSGFHGHFFGFSSPMQAIKEQRLCASKVLK